MPIKLGCESACMMLSYTPAISSAKYMHQVLANLYCSGNSHCGACLNEWKVLQLAKFDDGVDWLLKKSKTAMYRLNKQY